MPQRGCIAPWGGLSSGYGTGPCGPCPPWFSLLSDLRTYFSLSSQQSEGPITAQVSPHPSSAQTPVSSHSEKMPKILPVVSEAA